MKNKVHGFCKAGMHVAMLFVSVVFSGHLCLAEGIPYEKYTYFDGRVAPDGTNNLPRDLINQAISSGANEVTIPPGIYRMVPAAGTSSHIYITAASNLTINAHGVVMLCDKLTRAIGIRNCENLVVNGLTIDYSMSSAAVAPFTQG